jgi:diguanylate cyclase (GGDEF)-like protein
MIKVQITRSWQLIGTIAIGLMTFVGGAMFTGFEARDRLLRYHAEAEALAWAQHLAGTIDDLPAIIAGEEPSERSITYFRNAKAVGTIFRYKFFGANGSLRFVSDDARWSNFHNVNAGEVSAVALEVAQTGASNITSRKGDGKLRPIHFATAYVPLMQSGSRIGVVETYIDHTERARQIDTILILAGLVIAVLTASAFLMPMFFASWQALKRHEVTRRLHHAASHDALTGLLNRAAFMRVLEGQVQRRNKFALLALDLDHFKSINDSQGHPVGDAVLREVATRLSAVTPGSLHVARLGGDEFAVLQVLQSERSHEAVRTGERIVESLTMSYPIAEADLRIGASVGIAYFPADAQSIERLLIAADLALYAAKHAGRGRVEVFTPEIEDAHRRRQRIEQRLREALDEGMFELNYQPLYAADGLTLRAFEALLRLKDEDGTPIPPSVFIPIAEELHLIDRIGSWVLGEATRKAAEWPADILIAVNLSPLQFRSGELVGIVQKVLHDSGLPARRLELEVTESVLLDNVESVIEQLKALKALGASIALDDFGTGYSSLSYLWRFPFDTLKVDATFMSGLADPSSRSREVLDTIIALGKVLDLHVTAEGVETFEQMQLLRTMDCDFMQGYLFGRPVPEIDVASTILRSALYRLRGADNVEDVEQAGEGEAQRRRA